MMENRYINFKIEFKGLNFEVKLLDNKAVFPNTQKIGEKGFNFVEEFKVIVQHKDKGMTYKFYNSIMEREISQALQDKQNVYIWGNNGFMFSVKGFKQYMTKKHRWGGYDKITSLKDLEKQRIYNLFYGILNSFSLDMNTETDNFKGFCDTFGYEEDSRKAEKIFNAVMEFKSDVLRLNLTQEQRQYLNEEVNQETEKFRQDLKQVINNLQ